MPKAAYEIKLPAFEGPLDLLLYLIQKDKVDIYDIPIARITDEFLKYLELMTELDLNVASEFIDMASTLLRIKVQMLLPSRQSEEGAIEDPRDELVHQLIEYQKMREAALHLSSREESKSRQYGRSPGLLPEPVEPEQTWEASLFDLFSSFLEIKDRLQQTEKHHLVEKKEVTIEEKMAMIMTALEFQKRFLFFDLFKLQESRISIIVTFMAVLELLRLRQIRVRQHTLFSDIWIYLASSEPHPEEQITASEEQITAPEEPTQTSLPIK